ncbi:putative ribonuclease H-like domain-containing protein [Tanacetum coccineum]
MIKLLEKDSVFDFNEECIKAFEMLKEKLTNAPIMVSPDWSQPFELMCDASDFTVGAVLGQCEGKHFRLGYNAVPPPYTGNFMPPKPDLSFSGLKEFVNEPIVKKPVVETSEAKASADEPKVVRKDNSAPIIEDWVSDSEEEDVPRAKIKKKSVKHSFAKIKFGKSKEQVKTPRKTTVKQGQSTARFGGERRYVAFGGNPKGGKITDRGTIKTGNLDFENVYFVKELKFNLFSKTTKENFKSLALKAKVTKEQTSDDSDSQRGSGEDVDEEEAEAFNLMVKNFRKFFRRGNRFGNGANRFGRGRGNNFGNKGEQGFCLEEHGAIVKMVMNLKTMQHVSWQSVLKRASWLSILDSLQGCFEGCVLDDKDKCCMYNSISTTSLLVDTLYCQRKMQYWYCLLITTANEELILPGEDNRLGFILNVLKRLKGLYFIGLIDTKRIIYHLFGVEVEFHSFALRNFDLEDMEFETTHSNTTAKLPILKLGEYEMWVIRIKQYFQIQDYALWEVIENESLYSIFNRLQKIITRLAILGVVISQEDLNLKILNSLPPEWNTYVVVWMNKPEIETMSIDDLYNNFKIVEQKVNKSVGASSGAQNLAFMTAPSTSSTNDINTVIPAYEVSTARPNVNTANPQVSTASFSDSVVYAFMIENPNGSNILQHDLKQTHEDDLEVMDLKWQLSLLSMRAKRYYQTIGKKIFINANDTVGYDKSKVECFNCHKIGHFARECGAPRNKEGQFRNQANTRKQGNNEETSSKAMLAINGIGFDCSDMTEEQVQTNMALMAFLDSEVYADKTCSKTYLKNYETLKKHYDDLIVKLNQIEFIAATYKRGLATVKEQLITYRKNKVLLSEEVAVLKREPEFKGYGLENSKQESNIVCDQKSDDSKENSDDSLVKEQVSKVTSSFIESSLNVDKETVFLVDKKGNQRNWNGQKSNQLRSDFVMYNKACFICGSFNHVHINCDHHQRKRIVSRNNYNTVDYDYYAKTTHPSVHRNMTPRAVLLKIGLTPLNTVRPVNTTHPKPIVHSAKSMSQFSKQAQSTAQRPFYKQTSLTRRSVHTAKRHYYTEKPRAGNTARSYTGPVNVVRAKGPQQDDTGFVNSGCSRHMTGNIAYLSYFKVFDGGYVTFGGAHGGRISATKDETSEVLQNFIKEIENPVDKKVKIIICDNGTEFKNKVMDDFCREKGIRREYNVARTPQQNGVAERRNRTLVEAARTMVLIVKPHNKTPYELFIGFKPALSFMKPFGCHVTILNTLDSLGKFDGKSDEENKPMIEGNGPKWLFDIDSLTQYMNYVPVAAGTIINESAGTHRELNAGTSEEISQDFIVMPIWKDALYFDSLSKDVDNDEPKSTADDQKQVEDGLDNKNDAKDKSDDDSSPKEVNVAGQHVNTASTNITTGSFKLNDVGPSVNTFSHTLEATHVEFFSDEDEPEVDLGNITNSYTVQTTPNTRIHKDHPIKNVIGDVKSSVQTRRMTKPTSEQGFLSAVYEQKTHDTLNTCLYACFLSQIEPTSLDTYGFAYWKEGHWNKGHRQEEGIDYEEVFAPVARIKAIRLFLAYASFMGFLVYQMDVKSAFLYGTIEEEVYITQPPRFKDPDHPDKVYKVVKALYGLHQAPRAWYETLANYLLGNGFKRGKIDQTLFIKKQKGDILLVQVYVDDIIFGSTNKELCTGFEKLMKDKFQMSSMGELTFFLGLQVQQKEDGIFISQDKYVAEILKKFNYTDVKSASTPVDLEKPLVKDGDADDVDVHLYRSMIGSLMYLTASRPDIMFAVCACARFQVTPKTSHLLAVKRIFRYLKGKPTLGLWYSRDSLFELVAYTDSDYAGATQDRKSTTGGCQFLGNRLISWQCKKQTVVATSTTKAEYVAAASCCRQVGDEAVHKELGDRMERAATTASSLEAEQDSGNIK